MSEHALFITEQARLDIGFDAVRLPPRTGNALVDMALSAQAVRVGLAHLSNRLLHDPTFRAILVLI